MRDSLKPFSANTRVAASRMWSRFSSVSSRPFVAVASFYE